MKIIGVRNEHDLKEDFCTSILHRIFLQIDTQLEAYSLLLKIEKMWTVGNTVAEILISVAAYGAPTLPKTFL